jgi:hypothetical protein
LHSLPFPRLLPRQDPWAEGWVRTLRPLLLMLIGLAAGLLPLQAQSTSGPARGTGRPNGSEAPAGRPEVSRGDSGAADLSAFRIIADRNIFNATRSGARPGPARNPRRPARVETLALVGTLEAGTNRIAFFDGSDARFRKAVRTGEQVAGLAVQEIRFDRVYVVQDTRRWELPVGRALRREDEGEWQLADAVGLPAAAPADALDGSSGLATGAADSPAVSGEAAEILRKLMERRAREEQ